MASRIYLSDRIKIKDEFKDATRNFFRSESSNLDFSKPREAAKTINDWCSEQTNQKINEILGEKDLNSDTALVLVNAVYFKADWLNKFDKKCTKLRSFRLNDEDKSCLEVPTMYVEAKFFYGEVQELDAAYVVLPYVVRLLFFFSINFLMVLSGSGS